MSGREILPCAPSTASPSRQASRPHDEHRWVVLKIRAPFCEPLSENAGPVCRFRVSGARGSF